MLKIIKKHKIILIYFKTKNNLTIIILKGSVTGKAQAALFKISL
jgi:hypothetical protein